MNLGQVSEIFHFHLDQNFSPRMRKQIELGLNLFQDSQVTEVSMPFSGKLDSSKINIFILAQDSFPEFKKIPQTFAIGIVEPTQSLFSYGHSVDDSQMDFLLDDTFDSEQLKFILTPLWQEKSSYAFEKKEQQAVKNLKKFESKVKNFLKTEAFGHDELLSFSQFLGEFEKQLIQSENVTDIEKNVKNFSKIGFNKRKIQILSVNDFESLPDSENLLPLPPHKDQSYFVFLGKDELGSIELIKAYLFYFTLVNYLFSTQVVDDPFSSEKIWEEALDAIPFPVSLMSSKGELLQHNTLFSKFSSSPVDCLKLKHREKILINDIPYNVFRKEIYHLNEKKFLFVFFTESFFLKDQGGLTPSGQELGIISSSIAHELNNPIAGIQAALTLMMLDDQLNDESRQTLMEMKNGAMRCKQLIETFLGFSRATPGKRPITMDGRQSVVKLCYEQAQNLLRFRTVESGIRFSFEYSCHTEFRPTVNLSLLTMTFYLILGELMTLYSHHLLISDQNKLEKVIKGEIIESSQEIQIQLSELNISTCKFSKLIQNLLTIENLVLQSTEYSLRFIYHPPKDA